MADRLKLKQGDAGTVGVTLKINGEAVTDADLALLHCVEFMIGSGIRKVYPDDVTFSDGEFHVPYTQEETFALEEDEDIQIDVRVHFETNGAPEQVVGLRADFPKVKIIDAISEVVL